VTVSFTCVTHGAALTASCPSPVVLSTSKGHQSVTKSVTAVDGGASTITVSPINIDRTAPKIKVRGVKPGHTYRHARHLSFSYSDALSGMASHHVTTRHHTRHGVKRFNYVVTAVDRAGNVTTLRGSYSVRLH
jgi:hypothetical protein